MSSPQTRYEGQFTFITFKLKFSSLCFYYKNVSNLPFKVSFKPSRPFFHNQRPTPYSVLSLILLHVEDKQKFLVAVVGHELVSNGLNVRK